MDHSLLLVSKADWKDATHSTRHIICKLLNATDTACQPEGIRCIAACQTNNYGKKCTVSHNYRTCNGVL